jgi:hypothetical protein
MADWETPEPPQPKHWHDRPSARTAEEREAAFQRFLELSAPYFQRSRPKGPPVVLVGGRPPGAVLPQIHPAGATRWPPTGRPSRDPR